MFALESNSLGQIISKTAIFSCDACEFTTTQTANLKRHKDSVHHRIRYPCDQCHYSASQSAHLKRHKEARHQGIKYPCNQCDYLASRKDKLKDHIKKKHERKLNNEKENNESILKQILRTSPPVSSHRSPVIVHEKHPCNQCKFTTTSDMSLKLHKLERHTQGVIKVTGFPSQHQETNIQYPCEKCRFVAYSSSQLNAHTVSEHRTMNEQQTTTSQSAHFPCDQCVYVAASDDRLNWHKEYIHGKSVPVNNSSTFDVKKTRKRKAAKYRCESKHCSYTAFNTTDLVKHYINTHTSSQHTEASLQTTHINLENVPPTQTNAENDEFSQSSDIRYPCDLCGYAAPSQTSLQRHKQAQHKGMSHPCNECEYAANSPYRLTRHKQRMHTNHSMTKYSCNLCSYATDRVSSMNRHVGVNHKGRITSQDYTLANAQLSDILKSELGTDVVKIKAENLAVNNPHLKAENPQLEAENSPGELEGSDPGELQSMIDIVEHRELKSEPYDLSEFIA